MLQPSLYESGRERLPSGVHQSEIYFDELISRNHIDDAHEFVSDYIDEIVEHLTDERYESEFFHLQLKEIAMPMYRKYHADFTGEQYPDGREEIRTMYESAAILMRGLLHYADDGDGSARRLKNPRNDVDKKLIGDLSELTVFALAVRPLSGYRDDYTIIPSSTSQDRAYLDRQQRNRGHDFLVHNRDADTIHPLQVKTNRTRQVYHPDVDVLGIRSFTARNGISLTDTQKRIADDVERTDTGIAHLSHRMRLYMKEL